MQKRVPSRFGQSLNCDAESGRKLAKLVTYLSSDNSLYFVLSSITWFPWRWFITMLLAMMCSATVMISHVFVAIESVQHFSPLASFSDL